MKQTQELAITVFEHFKETMGNNEEYDFLFQGDDARSAEPARGTRLVYRPEQVGIRHPIPLPRLILAPNVHDGLTLYLATGDPEAPDTLIGFKKTVLELETRERKYRRISLYNLKEGNDINVLTLKIITFTRQLLKQH